MLRSIGKQSGESAESVLRKKEGCGVKDLQKRKFYTRKQGSCLEKEILQGTMPGARRRGRPRTAWMDNLKTWTGLSVEDSIRMTEDREKWRKYVHGVANPRIEDGKRTEQTRRPGMKE